MSREKEKERKEPSTQEKKGESEGKGNAPAGGRPDPRMEGGIPRNPESRR